MNKLRGVIFSVIFIIIFSIFLLIVNANTDDPYDTGGGGSADSNTRSYQAYTPSTIPEDTGAVYTAKTEDEEASLDATNVEEPLAIDSHTGSLTGEGWGASATYTNAIFNKNGIYQATITGIAAGATYYIISFTGEQVFKYTASEKESTQRKIIIDAGAKTWITLTMAQGDTISSGEAKTELPYTFTATEDKARYSFSEGAVTETEQGIFTYQGDFKEEFEVTDKVETALTTQGFYNVTLSPKTEYRYIYDTLNLSLENTDERTDISICKGSIETCEVQNKGNAFTITEKNIVLRQQGYSILESYDANNIIDINFAEQTVYLTNINPEEETLAIFRTGYFEITETHETIKAKALEKEYPMLFRTYDSDKPFPGWTVDDAQALVYEDEDNDAKILPSEELYIETCVSAVQEKIIGRRDSVPAFC